MLDLYGSGVEPFDAVKNAAMQQAVAQSVGHSITASQVQVSVVATYAGQQGRRRLQQGASKLVQPGVQLSVKIPTTQSLVKPVQSALSSAVASNQLVNAYKAQNGQVADYTTLVSQQVLGSNGQVAATPGSPPAAQASSSKKFPAWTIAIIVILVIALIAIVAGYLCYRKIAARRALRATSTAPVEIAKPVPSFAKASPPSGGKFVDDSPTPPFNRLVDARQQPSAVTPAMGTPVGSPYSSVSSPYSPVSSPYSPYNQRPAPVYVTPQRNPQVVDTIRGIGRI